MRVGTFANQYVRMCEFYSQQELDYYIVESVGNNFHAEDAMTYLDSTTILDYVKDPTEKLDIDKKLLEYLLLMGGVR